MIDTNVATINLIGKALIINIKKIKIELIGETNLLLAINIKLFLVNQNSIYIKSLTNALNQNT